MKKLNDKVHITAMGRTGVSRPARYLHENNLLQGRTLDYGSGRGYDADEYKLERYDPHWHNIEPIGKFDTIMCNFVLNVIFEEEIETVIEKVKALLNEGGVAYFTVRRDIPKEGWTLRGTYQHTVYLDLPIEDDVENGYCMYRYGEC